MRLMLIGKYTRSTEIGSNEGDNTVLSTVNAEYEVHQSYNVTVRQPQEVVGKSESSFSSFRLGFPTAQATIPLEGGGPKCI